MWGKTNCNAKNTAMQNKNCNAHNCNLMLRTPPCLPGQSFGGPGQNPAWPPNPAAKKRTVQKNCNAKKRHCKRNCDATKTASSCSAPRRRPRPGRSPAGAEPGQSPAWPPNPARKLQFKKTQCKTNCNFMLRTPPGTPRPGPQLGRGPAGARPERNPAGARSPARPPRPAGKKTAVQKQLHCKRNAMQQKL